MLFWCSISQFIWQRAPLTQLPHLPNRGYGMRVSMCHACDMRMRLRQESCTAIDFSVSCGGGEMPTTFSRPTKDLIFRYSFTYCAMLTKVVKILYTFASVLRLHSRFIGTSVFLLNKFNIWFWRLEMRLKMAAFGPRAIHVVAQPTVEVGGSWNFQWI